MYVGGVEDRVRWHVAYDIKLWVSKGWSAGLLWLYQTPCKCTKLETGGMTATPWRRRWEPQIREEILRAGMVAPRTQVCKIPMQIFGTQILDLPEPQTLIKNALGSVLILVNEYEGTKKHGFLPLGVGLVQTRYRDDPNEQIATVPVSFSFIL